MVKYSYSAGMSAMSAMSSANTKLQDSVHINKVYEVENKTGVIVTVKDSKGGLNKILNLFNKFEVNLTYIKSRPSRFITKEKHIDYIIDFEGKQDDLKVTSIISELMEISTNFQICKTPQVPWFPVNFTDLDSIGKTTLCEGDGIQMTDHPGFNDKEYKRRR